MIVVMMMVMMAMMLMNMVSESEYIDAEIQNDNKINPYQKGEKDNHGPTDSASPYHHTLLHK